VYCKVLVFFSLKFLWSKHIVNNVRYFQIVIQFVIHVQLTSYEHSKPRLQMAVDKGSEFRTYIQLRLRGYTYVWLQIWDLEQTVSYILSPFNPIWIKIATTEIFMSHICSTNPETRWGSIWNTEPLLAIPQAELSFPVKQGWQTTGTGAIFDSD